MFRIRYDSAYPSTVGIDRRRFIKFGAAGLTLLDFAGSSTVAAPKQNRNGFGRAKSCIILFLKGGPSHLDTFDMKPDSPAEVRGEFRPIRTTVPGIDISEHLPRLAMQAKHFTLIRSMSLATGDGVHSTAAYEMTTGQRYPRRGEAIMTREDHPHFGSAAAAVGADLGLPAFAMVPQAFIVNGEYRGGQNAGLLGSRFDPLVPGGDPNATDFRPINLGLESAVQPDRTEGRRRLLESLNASARGWNPADAHDLNYTKAFAMLADGRARDAFNLDAESSRVRDLYGRNTFGQSVFLARRLVEAGVRFVHVNCMSTIVDGENSWDTHKDNFQKQKNSLLPRADRAIAALLQDLADRGLLKTTLVLVMGEFGRTPKINAEAGRDHWPQCFSVLAAGAGIPGGRIYGASDRIGAYPRDCRVTPPQLGATIFHALGIDPRAEVRTIDGRPTVLLPTGEPVLDLFQA